MPTTAYTAWISWVSGCPSCHPRPTIKRRLGTTERRGAGALAAPAPSGGPPSCPNGSLGVMKSSPVSRRRTALRAIALEIPGNAASTGSGAALILTAPSLHTVRYGATASASESSMPGMWASSPSRLRGACLRLATTCSACLSVVNCRNNPCRVAASARFRSRRAFRSTTATPNRPLPRAMSLSGARRAPSSRNVVTRSGRLRAESRSASIRTAAARIPLSAL